MYIKNRDMIIHLLLGTSRKLNTHIHEKRAPFGRQYKDTNCSIHCDVNTHYTLLPSPSFFFFFSSRERGRDAIHARIDMRNINLGLAENDESPRLRKDHVRRRAPDEELAEQSPVRGPDVHAIAAPRVHVPLRVDLQPVGYACVGVCKGAPLEEGRGGGIDGVCVAG